MTKTEMCAIRASLSMFASYDESKVMRERLHQSALLDYQPKYTHYDYLDFMNRNAVSIDKISPQDTNHRYYFCLFSIPSQHVYGDCVEECLDNAIDSERSANTTSRSINQPNRSEN